MKVLYKTLLFAVVLMAGFLILSTTAQSKQKVSGPILISRAIQGGALHGHVIVVITNY